MSFQVNDQPAKVTITEEENTVTIAAPGPAGPGVPQGGSTGQVLAKESNTDYETEWVTPKTVATDPMWDAVGDLAVGSGADTASRLPVGTTNQVLMADPSQPLGVKWSSEIDPNAIQKSIVDAKGDLIVASAADTPDRLPVGTTNQVLVADPSAPLGVSWVDPTPKDASYVTLGTDGTLTNERVLTAGTGISVTDAGAGSTVTVATSAILPTVVDAKGDLIVGSAADTVDRLPVGTTNQVLMADPAAPLGVKWSSEIDPTAIPKSIVDAKGDLIVGSSSDTPDRLPVGATNQVLVADPTAPLGVGWVDPTPKNASYVTLGTDGTLTDERVLTAGSGITVTDAGAGSTVTVATPLVNPQYVTLASSGDLTNERVLTAGSGISVTDGGAGSSVTVASFQPGGAARPLLTAGAYLDGTNGLVLSGIGGGNNASAPDSAALSITGDIDIKVKVTLPDWTPSVDTFLVTKDSGMATGTSYRFFVETIGTLRFQNSVSGNTAFVTATSSAPVGFSDNETKWVRATLDVDDGSGNRVYKFYTSDDGTTWTQLGTTLTDAGTTSIFDSTQPTRFGNSQFVSNSGSKTIARVIIQDAYDTADNTTNLVFDADFAAQTADALAFTESSTNAATVTINTGRYTVGLPDRMYASVSTQALTANVDYFTSFTVKESLIVDMLAFEVTTAPSSTSTVHAAIYAADGNLQPTGAPVASWGAISVATSTTGNYFTQITPVTLGPGTYTLGFNASVAFTARSFRVPAMLIHTLGANPIITLIQASRTNAAFPNPSTGWNIRSASTVGLNTFAALRWRPA